MRCTSFLRASLALLAAAGCDAPLDPPPGASRDGSVGDGSARDGSLDAPVRDGPAAPPGACEGRFPAAEPPSRAQEPLAGGFAHDARVEGWLAAAPPAPYTGLPDSVTSALLVDLDGDGRTDMIFNDHRDFCGGSRPGSRSWVLWQGADGALRAPELLDGLRNCLVAADLRRRPPRPRVRLRPGHRGAMEHRGALRRGLPDDAPGVGSGDGHDGVGR